MIDRDLQAEASMHTLLLRLAGTMPDDLLKDARTWLAGGRRADVARSVTFAALSQPMPMGSDEIDLLRKELMAAKASEDLVSALEEVRGERPNPTALFRSALVNTEEAVLPVDLTGGPDTEWDAVDRAVVDRARDTEGVRAVWRSWRMPHVAKPWAEPIRVFVVSVEESVESLPRLAVMLREVAAAAGDEEAQIEVCWLGLDAPYYQTLARSCGALLWAVRSAAPIETAQVFDGVHPERGPWFTSNRPMLADKATREQLVARLRAAPIVSWCSTDMTDVLDPQRGAVVPLHLRSDGNWIWSDAVAYYVEQHHLEPDQGLMAHLSGPAGREPLDEISLHRVLAYLSQPTPEDVVWQVPAAVTPQ